MSETHTYGGMSASQLRAICAEYEKDLNAEGTHLGRTVINSIFSGQIRYSIGPLLDRIAELEAELATQHRETVE